MTAVEVVETMDLYTPLVAAIIKSWSRSAPWLEHDFTSDVSLRLWRALTAVQSDQVHKLGAFIRVVARRAILRRIYTEKIRNRAAFHSQPPGVGNDGETIDAAAMLASEEPGPEEAAELADDVAAIPELLARLDEDRRELVLRRVVDGEALTAIAAPK